MAEIDQSLIDAIASGEKSAFDAVYRSHKDHLLTVTVVTLGIDSIAAEDVLHDVFIRLAECSSTLRLKVSLRSFLISCCLNRGRDLLRREKIRQRAVQSRSETIEHVSPDEAVEQAEANARIIDLLCKLPAEQREVVTLHLHGGLTFAEVAESCQIPLDTAKSRYRYALSKLQKWWSNSTIPTGDQHDT